MIKQIFGLRKEERWLFLGMLLFATCLCAMNIYHSFGFFGHFVKGGFWTMVAAPKHMVSGYDQFSLLDLSRPQNIYPPFRHLLMPFLLYPGYLLNHWLMGIFHKNCGQFIIAAWNILMAAYACVFLYRILHERLLATKVNSLLLCLLFFSFGHVMLSIMVADTFCTSMFLLFMAYYAATLEWSPSIKTSVFWGALFFFAAGVTLTNGCLVAIASWYALGTRRLFSIRHIAVGFIVPLMLLGTAAVIEYGPMNFFYHPKNEDKNSTVTTKNYDRVIATWFKYEGNRAECFTENFWGESIQLHSDHFLGDYDLRQQGIVIHYQNPIPYIIEILMFVLLMVGIWLGRRDRYLWMMLGCLAFNLLLHIVLSFGIDEAYIFTTHWAIAIPVFYAVLSHQRWFAPAVASLAVYLLVSNLWLMVPYFL